MSNVLIISRAQTWGYMNTISLEVTLPSDKDLEISLFFFFFTTKHAPLEMSFETL